MSDVNENRDLELHLQGPGERPETADPIATLDLARAYFELLVNIAEEHGLKLELRGLHVKSGSTVVASTPLQWDVAMQVMTDASRYVSGVLPPPPPLEKRVETVRGKVIHLPTHMAVVTKCGGETRPLSATMTEKHLPPREVTELRATLVGIGGAGRPMARFSSRSEARGFALKTDHDTARKLAPLLYSPVDIVAEVRRDEKGFIHSGILQEYRTVYAGPDEVQLWREWFREVGGDWNDIDDIDQELGRV
ncbi:MAG TPA: hypothetical protein VEU33_22940 [Archangium sp.]|nr:hypothetical protein [Archangium sp.]